MSRGSDFVSAVEAGFEVSLAERVLLVELGRMIDLADVLEAEVAARPLVDGGVNPIQRELRQLRGEIRHHLAALKLPDALGSVIPSGRSTAAAKAARSRWKERDETA